MAARVHSFTESRANSTLFDEERPVLVPFRPQDTYPSHLSSGDGAQLLSVPETRETLRAKDSNLHFIFMSVVDCPEARSVISEFATQMLGTKPGVEREFQLLGMYDLIGYWDLAVRCRMSSGSSIDHIVRLLHTELVNKGMVADVNEGQGSPFGLFKHIAVTRELQALVAFFSDAERAEIRRTWLETTDRYEERRFQRGFLHIDVADRNNMEIVVKNLRSELAADGEVETIIECVYVSENALVFELFMNARQMPLLTRLNRVIEPALKEVKAQKYTLLCYGYDERDTTNKSPISTLPSSD